MLILGFIDHRSILTHNNIINRFSLIYQKYVPLVKEKLAFCYVGNDIIIACHSCMYLAACLSLSADRQGQTGNPALFIF